MKKFSKRSIASVLVITLVLGIGLRMATGSVVHAAQATVDLKTAAPFAILAGTPSITETGTSVITGNVGLSPATGAGIIGLTCAEVTGTIYAVDAAGPAPCAVNNPGLLTIAKNDLTAAFIDAAGRTPVVTIPTELGGTTRTAGVYDSASTTFQISAGAGPLVIDGQGDPNAVFIFEMGFAGTGLTVGPGSTVSLINGASACNIYWRVETATINTTAVFKGNILALTSITVANGANIEGRLLARNGLVSLINDTITIPTSCVASAGSGSGTTAAATPGLPNTGLAPEEKQSAWFAIVPSGLLVVLLLLYFIRKKRTM